MEKRTAKPDYIKPIIDALTKLGTTTEEELLKEIYQTIHDKLYTDDYVVLPNGEPRWRNQAQNMLDGLIETGAVSKEKGLLKLIENPRP